MISSYKHIPTRNWCHFRKCNWTKNVMNGVLGCFIMAMPFKRILILYVIPSKLSCDFSKLTDLYVYMYMYIFFYDKKKLFFMSRKYVSVCLLPLCTSRLNYWIITSEPRRNTFVSLKLEGARICDIQLSNAPGPALYIDRALHKLPIYSVIGSLSRTE